MNILADSNILYAKEAFSEIGDVTVVEGRDITRDRLENIDILLVRSITRVNRQLLENTRVKFVASATIGTDHVDLDFLREHNIGFAHAPGSNANSVAEYVISALVHLSKKNGLVLSNLTLGIIGVGNIGSRVYTLAQALGMKCLLNDPPKKAMTKSDIYLPLSTVLAGSDIITLHVPIVTTGADATYRMANDGFFLAMKKKAMFINTSRGDVVDENSLRLARQNLSAVALDVWSNEPSPYPATIAACDIATPHIAGYSFAGKAAGTKMVFNAVCAYFFMEKIWHIPGQSADHKRIVIDKKVNYDHVSAAVEAAYLIMDDDSRFRMILDKDGDKKAEFFDNLRRNYPKRLEFSNYMVTMPKEVPQATVSKLISLGFKVSAMS